ncbi:TPA: ATP-binding protein [Clostridioides difficile]|nr:ATP-binding protein [Clostridioides difficile]
MRMIWNKGHRIRASDKHLVYHFSIGTFLFVFVAVVLLLNIKQLMRTDWEHFSLLENGLTLSPYNFITILIATGVCALVAFLYVRFCYDSFKKMVHRQKLARMILENKWYEAEQTKESGFFTDLPSSSKEKIVWFPKIYYQMKNGLLHIQCEISMGKYQEQLLNLEDKLESGLYCELTDKVLHDGYIEYTLLYDMVANRISIDEVKAEHGGLKLMKNLVWEYDALPHALIAGGTGGGKTYFLLTIIETLLQTNAVLFILDPKNADLADLGTVMPNVYHTKEDMINCVNSFYEGMVSRSEEMKQHPNYKTGENYAYLGLAPHFLIFDEYVAFFEMLGAKESMNLLSQLKKIVMLGRQAGYFLIVACQRPDAKYFTDGIRDNFNFRVGLGRMSELGYGMLFGSDVKKKFFQKRIKGRGYCDVGTSVISEFYTPLVPKGHDFLKEIGRLARERQVLFEEQGKDNDNVVE